MPRNFVLKIEKKTQEKWKRSIFLLHLIFFIFEKGWNSQKDLSPLSEFDHKLARWSLPTFRRKVTFQLIIQSFNFFIHLMSFLMDLQLKNCWITQVFLLCHILYRYLSLILVEHLNSAVLLSANLIPNLSMYMRNGKMKGRKTKAE